MNLLFSWGVGVGGGGSQGRHDYVNSAVNYQPCYLRLAQSSSWKSPPLIGSSPWRPARAELSPQRRSSPPGLPAEEADLQWDRGRSCLCEWWQTVRLRLFWCHRQALINFPGFLCFFLLLFSLNQSTAATAALAAAVAGQMWAGYSMIDPPNHQEPSFFPLHCY